MSASALVKHSLGTLLGLIGAAMALTWVFLAMRAVMDVGGSCGSGGPYVIAHPCPQGVPLVMIGGIFGGLISVLIYALAVFDTGPRLVLLAWPALFLSLGYNFAEYGLRSPVSVSLIVCAVLFFLMGGLPLLLLVKPSTFVAVFWSGAPTKTPLSLPRRVPTFGTAAAGSGASGSRASGSRASGSRASQSGASRAASAVAAVIPASAPVSPGAQPPGEDADSIIVALERLTSLHERGALTDAEFAQAKARLLDKETP